MISEQQLKTWSNKIDLNKNKETLQRVKNIFSGESFNGSRYFEIYRQGSVANHTNIWNNGDIDVILQLNNFDHAYSFEAFLSEIKDVLDRSGINYEEKNKCIELKLGDGYQNVDLLPCFLYIDPHGNKGIQFLSSYGNIINYPKQHIGNGADKNLNTNQNYKKTIRIFKNINKKLVDEGYIEDKLAPSYFIECFLYNFHNNLFRENYFKKILANIFDGFNNTSEKVLYDLKCQNGITPLFGSGSTQWNLEDCVKFMEISEKYFKSQETISGNNFINLIGTGIFIGVFAGAVTYFLDDIIEFFSTVINKTVDIFLLIFDKFLTENLFR